MRSFFADCPWQLSLRCDTTLLPKYTKGRLQVGEEMPLIPERLQSRQDVKSAIACQFWEQPSHSTRSIDGLVWSLPCEPPALNLTGSSGLSRTQQLIAAQALGAPAVPSYDANSEGLVGAARLCK